MVNWKILGCSYAKIWGFYGITNYNMILVSMNYLEGAT